MIAAVHTYVVGDIVAQPNRKLAIREITDDGYYICTDEQGYEVTHFFTAEELTPYDGSDLQWRREGRQMYEALKAENAALAKRIAKLERARRADEDFEDWKSSVQDDDNHTFMDGIGF